MYGTVAYLLNFGLRGKRKRERKRKEAEMLEGSRTLELNINLWWFICCGRLQAPSAHCQLLAPVSWPWTWMWNPELQPRACKLELSWLWERRWRPGQVVVLSGMTICVKATFCTRDMEVLRNTSPLKLLGWVEKKYKFRRMRCPYWMCVNKVNIKWSGL